MLTFHESFRPMNHCPGENDDCRSVDYHGARYCGPWRLASGRIAHNYIGDKHGPERRALALGLLILRAQRREHDRLDAACARLRESWTCPSCGTTGTSHMWFCTR